MQIQKQQQKKKRERERKREYDKRKRTNLTTSCGPHTTPSLSLLTHHSSSVRAEPSRHPRSLPSLPPSLLSHPSLSLKPPCSPFLSPREASPSLPLIPIAFGRLYRAGLDWIGLERELPASLNPPHPTFLASSPRASRRRRRVYLV